jgi:hypothetical protein
LKGLIIREPWIDMILKSGSGKVYGTVELIDSIPLERLALNQISPGYAHPYAWLLQNPIRYDEPIPYKHPQGAVIWVNLGAGQLSKNTRDFQI